VGNLTDRHVAGSLGGADITIAVHKAMQPRGWGDVMDSGAVVIGGGIAIKHMGRGDSNSGLTLDENEFNLVDKHKIFI